MPKLESKSLLLFRLEDWSAFNMWFFFLKQDKPSPPPTDKCGSPEHSQDVYCDDENNNAGCNWDDGACCDNEYPGWNTFCKDCECLEPRK